MKKSQLVAHFRKSKPFHEFVPVSCFVSDTVFVTKNGDYGTALQLKGIDAECLTDERLESVMSALNAAFRLFGEEFRVYQYLVKNRKSPVVRKSSYQNALVEQAVADRVAYLEKTAPLGAISLYVVILWESDPNASDGGEAYAVSSASRLRGEHGRATVALKDDSSFIHPVPEGLPFEPRIGLQKQEAFLWAVSRKLLNLTDDVADRIPLKRNTDVDWQSVATRLDWQRNGRLTFDDRAVKVISLKELPSSTGPNMFRDVLEVDCDMILCTQWIRRSNPEVRRAVKLKKGSLFLLQHQEREFHHCTKPSTGS